MDDLKLLQGALARDLHTGETAVFPTTLTSVMVVDQVAEFSAKYQIYNLLRKVETTTVSEELREEAFKAFLKIQKRGEEFNENFQEPSWFGRARDIVHRLLPPLGLIESELWPLCKFGPGTFNGAKDALAYSLHYKIGHDQTVTPACRGLLVDVLQTHFPAWAERLARWGRKLHIVEGNRLSHVPKDVSKCRPIAIEPSGNLFLQQGIGRWLVMHLARVGFVDLRNQEPNRRAAGDLSNGTIDLSNASDTIFLKLVESLFPPDWYELLLAARCGEWAYRDVKGTYVNLSSQGNAFTFPVESLIFKAIAVAVSGLSESDIIVYGDDIIAPASYCQQIADGLEVCGFTVNTEKSYWGQHDDVRRYFRESCGADYFMGVLITPVYVRTRPTKLSEWAVIYNRIYERWPTARRALSHILLQIPERLRNKVLIGPRYWITDNLSFLEDRDAYSPLGGRSPNFVVSTYSTFFWNVGPLEDFPVSGRAWASRPCKISKRNLLGGEVSETVFIYGGEDTLPRSDRPTTRLFNNQSWSAKSLGGSSRSKEVHLGLRWRRKRETFS